MKPNIIFYFSDQQRWDTLNDELMPNVWELGDEGILFENSFTCQPVCGPARACLQTGQYATENGCFWNGIPLPDDTKTMADYFNENGYDTAYIGKWHLASQNGIGGFHCEKTAVPEEKQGGYKYWRAADVLEFTSHGYDGYVFDESGNKIEFNGYRADCINDFAIEYVNNHNDEKPFFMFVSQLEPHHQNDRGHFEGPVDTVENYTSDHGYHFKTRNFEYKRSCHESCVHTPLVFGGGAVEKAENKDDLVSLIDLPPTILHLAGISVPDSYSGRVLPVNGEEGNQRDCVFIQISESQVGRAVRTKDWKYSARAIGSGWHKPKAVHYFDDFLYDLKNDPYEKNNLVNNKNYAKTLEQMRGLLAREMVNAGERKPIFHKPFKPRKY